MSWCLAACLLVSAGAWAAPVIRVEVEGGRVTIEAQDAPLVELLQRLGTEAGFRTVVTGDIDVRVSRIVRDVTIEEGVRRLAGTLPVVMLYEPAPGRSPPVRLAEVRLYPRVEGSRPVPGSDRRSRAQVSRERTAGEVAANLASASALERDASPGSVRRLTELALRDEDPAVRARAVDALGRLGPDDNLEALAAAYSDDVQQVRLHVLRALGRADSPEAIEFLGGILQGDGETRERQIAAGILARNGGPLARPFLEAAANDPDPGVRKTTSRLIGIRTRQGGRSEAARAVGPRVTPR